MSTKHINSDVYTSFTFGKTEAVYLYSVLRVMHANMLSAAADARRKEHTEEADRISKDSAIVESILTQILDAL